MQLAQRLPQKMRYDLTIDSVAANGLSYVKKQPQ